MHVPNRDTDPCADLELVFQGYVFLVAGSHKVIEITNLGFLKHQNWPPLIVLWYVAADSDKLHNMRMILDKGVAEYYHFSEGFFELIALNEIKALEGKTCLDVDLRLVDLCPALPYET